MFIKHVTEDWYIGFTVAAVLVLRKLGQYFHVRAARGQARRTVGFKARWREGVGCWGRWSNMEPGQVMRCRIPG